MNAETIKSYAEALQAFLVSAAVVAGGVWTYVLFVRKREDQPKSEAELSVEQRMLGNDRILVRVTVTIRNIGDVRIPLAYAQIAIKQILPASVSLLESFVEGRHSVADDKPEITWPLLGMREWNWEEKRAEIEPKETDFIHAYFVIPATIRTVEIYAYLRKRVSRHDEIGWRVSELYDVANQHGQYSQRVD